jgi:hypothetical protein
MEQDPDSGEEHVGVVLLVGGDFLEFLCGLPGEFKVEIALRSPKCALGFWAVNAIAICQVEHVLKWVFRPDTQPGRRAAGLKSSSEQE